MSTATIELESSGAYTNLDIVRGKVHVSLKSETAVKSIVVKMEGVAKTIVPIVEENHQNNGKRREGKNDAIEIHKLLYKTVTVFPPSDVQQNSSSNQFTLPAGNYTYDFQFKIPLKSNCAKSGGGTGGMLGQLVFNAGGLDHARSAGGHVDALLPPSLSGFGENASVKYFVKATVNKASMFRMNTRTTNPFILLPMDVPLIDEGKIAFVRRELSVGLEPPPSQRPQQNSSSKGKGKLMGFLSGVGFSDFMGVNSVRGPVLQFSLEARYPKTGSIVAVSELPLKLYLLTSTPPGESNTKQVNLQELTLNLYATTECKAQSHRKVTELCLPLCQKKDLNVPVPLASATQSQARTANGSPMYEVQLDPALLQGVQIPDFVPPTFTTCNINRKYSLEIHAGFQANPQLPIEYVSLAIDIVVRSGIPVPQNPETHVPSIPPQPSNTQPNEKTHMDNSNGYGHQGPQITSEGQQLTDNDALPTYDDAVGSSSSGAPPPLPARRNFAQSEDYYKNLESYD